MGSGIGGRIPLKDSDTKSLTPALAVKLKSEAGRVRFLTEMAMGQSQFAGEAPVAMVNPDGGLGVNFSGPPFGSAWKHVLFVRGGCKQNVSGTVTGQRQVGVVAPGADLAVPISYWSRNFAGGSRGPYSRAYISFRGYRLTGAGNVTVTVQLDKGAGTPFRTGTAIFSSGTEGVTEFALSGLWWDIPIGGLQKLRVLFSTTTAASSVMITALCGYQGVKRTH